MQVDFLTLLKNVLDCHNIQITKVVPPFDGLENFDYGLRKALDPVFDWPGFGSMLFEQTPSCALVLAEGVFELHFAFFRLPGEEEVVWCVGPWTIGPRSQKSIDWAKKNLDQSGNAAIEEYYNGVRIVQENALDSELYAMLSTVYAPAPLEVRKWHEFMPLNFRPDMRYFSEPSFQQEMLAAMIEQRYEIENRVLSAVGRGDITAALAAMEQFHRFRITSRFGNPLRDGKNLTIVLNSLLRKSIENASVHPFYVDKISCKYALRIENATSDAELAPLRVEMVKEYCAYVQRYSLRNYSPLVQKVINHINLNLDAALSLKSLAAMCFISPSYLSNIFKQETGQTLTDYINTQRIRRAAVYLASGNVSIAAVAESVGILDVNYFTKMFKKTMGVTPTRYRRENRER
ncbi:MAG: helix-turn-helix domain-containing protein [Gemmiger sp.]